MERIVIASAVSRSPAILREFLAALERLDPDGCTLEWIFVDDNGAAESSALLHNFMRTRVGGILLPPPRGQGYGSEDATPRWSIELVDRVAAHKDRILTQALARGADAVLLVDSDLVLHPLTLEVLRAADVDIVSEVFWTEFNANADRLPNVWMTDYYTLFATRGDPPPEARAASATDAFLRRLALPGLHDVGGLGACTLIRRRALEAGVRFAHLPNVSWIGEDRHFCVRATALGFTLWADTHVPPLHLYRPSDLGQLEAHRAAEPQLETRWRTAVTARRAAEAAFARAGAAILTDEMRHDLAQRLEPGAEVGIRALGNVVASIAPHVDGMKVELEVELAAADARPPWQCRAMTEIVVPLPPAARTAQPMTEIVISLRSDARPRAAPPLAPEVLIPRHVPILLSMIVRNEADRHLRAVLALLAQIVDDALIIDDASTDQTPELCRDLLARVPHRVEVLPHSLFEHEHELRALQYRLAMERRPTWILNLDADELFEDHALELLPLIARCASTDLIGFRLFDMWDPAHYRSDELWTAHRRYWPVLARPQPNQPVTWRRSNQHCGRWPLSISRQPMEVSSLRIQHLGWMRAEDRIAKYARYQRLDPGGGDGSPSQYKSILDPSPNLLSWEPG